MSKKFYNNILQIFLRISFLCYFFPPRLVLFGNLIYKQNFKRKAKTQKISFSLFFSSSFYSADNFLNTLVAIPNTQNPKTLNPKNTVCYAN